MEKKVYIRPSMTVVKIRRYKILTLSDPDAPQRHDEVSTQDSY